MSGEHHVPSNVLTLPLGDSDRERIAHVYHLDAGGPDAVAWDDLLARAAGDDAPITLLEIARLLPGARPQHDAYLTAARAATEKAGGSLVAMADILEPGVGDLLSYMDCSGGVAILLAFPSRKACLAALISDDWQAGLAARGASVADAVVLVAGENTIPPMARTMLGEPRMAATRCRGPRSNIA